MIRRDLPPFPQGDASNEDGEFKGPNPKLEPPENVSFLRGDSSDPKDDAQPITQEQMMICGRVSSFYIARSGSSPAQIVP